MIVHDLNSSHSVWKISASPKSKQRTNASQLHTSAIKLLKKIYPLYSICQEVPINIYYSNWLYLDIYLPIINMAIEVHGKQHYKFNTLFHRTSCDFVQQKHNDRLKKEWCKVNNIALVSLPYNETIEQWKSRILDYEY